MAVIFIFYLRNMFKSALYLRTTVYAGTELKFTLQDTYTLADSGFFLDFQYQVGVKSTVSGVFEGLKFKISEGQDKN